MNHDILKKGGLLFISLFFLFYANAKKAPIHPLALKAKSAALVDNSQLILYSKYLYDQNINRLDDLYFVKSFDNWWFSFYYNDSVLYEKIQKKEFQNKLIINHIKGWTKLNLLTANDQKQLNKLLDLGEIYNFHSLYSEIIKKIKTSYWNNPNVCANVGEFLYSNKYISQENYKKFNDKIIAKKTINFFDAFNNENHFLVLHQAYGEKNTDFFQRYVAATGKLLSTYYLNKVEIKYEYFLETKKDSTESDKYIFKMELSDGAVSLLEEKNAYYDDFNTFVTREIPYTFLNSLINRYLHAKNNPHSLFQLLKPMAYNDTSRMCCVLGNMKLIEDANDEYGENFFTFFKNYETFIIIHSNSNYYSSEYLDNYFSNIAKSSFSKSKFFDIIRLKQLFLGSTYSGPNSIFTQLADYAPTVYYRLGVQEDLDDLSAKLFVASNGKINLKVIAFEQVNLTDETNAEPTHILVTLSINDSIYYLKEEIYFSTASLIKAVCAIANNDLLQQLKFLRSDVYNECIFTFISNSDLEFIHFSGTDPELEITEPEDEIIVLKKEKE